MLNRLVVIFFILLVTGATYADNLEEQAENSIRKAVTFFHSINTHGGYVYYVTPDLSRRWGEGPKDAVEVWYSYQLESAVFLEVSRLGIPSKCE